ncbi:MAG: hypothetical protein H7A50_04880 [Akkermansiaceae bacterium]|nr:hypothetical protein [Akkermansiaceae bacterium]
MRFRPLHHLLSALVLSMTARGAEPDAGGWIDRLHREQRIVADEEGRMEKRWRAFSADLPVFADWLRQDLGGEASGILLADREAELTRRLVEKLSATESAPTLQTYLRLATERREKRIAGTLKEWGPIAFTEGHAYRMSFIGYTEGLSDARNERFFQPGARLSVLDFSNDPLFGTKKVLIDDPRGMMRDVDVSFDRGKLLFAWKKSDRLDDYHVYEYNVEDGACRQLTEGLGRADYEPIYLPDGGIIFTSTRPEQSVPCWWTEISNLYRMDADGRNIRRLAIDQVHALYPQLMADGRVTYTRWDYNDRGQNFPHPVFSMRPDGKDQRAFYGGNSWFPTSLLHTRGIPGSHKAMAVAAGHHTHQQGKLVVLDTNEGRDEGRGMSFIAPSREHPYERVDRAMQDGDQFRYPFPFSENEFLVSCRMEGGKRFALYWMDADGGRELLHASRDLDIARMVTLGRKPEVKTIPEEIDYSKETGTYYVKDVYQGVGLEGIERGAAKKIRVVALDYRAAGVGMTGNGGEGGGALNSSPVAIGNGTWDVKRILGDVDIEDDGSARFEVPAMESIYLQVLDDKGQVIQTSRTWDTLRPGETKGCAGCHDKTNGNQHPYHPEETLAWKRAAQKLQPFHGPARGFSFPREIQPILDSKCVSCHDGADPERMDLRGLPVDDADTNQRRWTRSYLNLTGAGRSDRGDYRADPARGPVNWISKMSRPTEIPPYSAGAARSKLLEMLDAGHEGAELTTVERDKIAAWIDLLVPFSGDYREGHAWSGREMAYYNYYEGKREVGAAEEKAMIAAHLGLDRPAEKLPAFTTARYRDAWEGSPVEVVDGRPAAPADAPRWFVDVLRLASASGERPELVIRDVRKGGVLATVPAGRESVEVALASPARTDGIVFETGGHPASGIVVESARGVRLDEVPVVDGYHPFLDIGESR